MTSSVFGDAPWRPFAPDHEHSEWMRTAVARQLALVDRLGLPATLGLVLVPLVDPPPARRDKAGRRVRRRWDRTCDRCGRYVPSGEDFVVGMTHQHGANGAQVAFTFGLCVRCSDLEGA